MKRGEIKHIRPLTVNVRSSENNFSHTSSNVQRKTRKQRMQEN